MVGRYLRQHHLALVAIFIALMGTAYAGNQLESKKVVVEVAKGKKGKKGKPGPQGPPGAQGLQGPQGQQGNQGPAGSPDTPAQVLGKLAQVDGLGSGLDADKVDGSEVVTGRASFSVSGPIPANTCFQDFKGPIPGASAGDLTIVEADLPVGLLLTPEPARPDMAIPTNIVAPFHVCNVTGAEINLTSVPHHILTLAP